jgi:hypothetical protein
MTQIVCSKCQPCVLVLLAIVEEVLGHLLLRVVLALPLVPALAVAHLALGLLRLELVGQVARLLVAQDRQFFQNHAEGFLALVAYFVFLLPFALDVLQTVPVPAQLLKSNATHYQSTILTAA